MTKPAITPPRRAMLLAAGRGQRLGALTTNTPKPLLKIGTQRLIEYQIRALQRAGFRELVVNISYHAEQIQHVLGNGDRYGCSILYSREPKPPLDSGGGIVQALGLLGPEPFVVANADILTDFDYRSLPAPSADGAHLVLVPNPPHNPAGDFSYNDAQISASGAPRYTFAGIGVYHPRMFLNPPGLRFSMVPLLRDLAAAGHLSGQLYCGHWLDVGTPQRLKQACEYVATKEKFNIL